MDNYVGKRLDGRYEVQESASAVCPLFIKHTTILTIGLLQ